jgi:hypothetical protein
MYDINTLKFTGLKDVLTRDLSPAFSLIMHAIDTIFWTRFETKSHQISLSRKSTQIFANNEIFCENPGNFAKGVRMFAVGKLEFFFLFLL